MDGRHPSAVSIDRETPTSLPAAVPKEWAGLAASGEKTIISQHPSAQHQLPAGSSLGWSSLKEVSPPPESWRAGTYIPPGTFLVLPNRHIDSRICLFFLHRCRSLDLGQRFDTSPTCVSEQSGDVDRAEPPPSSVCHTHTPGSVRM